MNKSFPFHIRVDISDWFYKAGEKYICIGQRWGCYIIGQIIDNKVCQPKVLTLIDTNHAHII